METIQEYTVNVDELVLHVSILGGRGLTKQYFIQLPQLAPATRALMENIKHGLVRDVAVSSSEITDPGAITKMKDKFRERATALFKAKMPSIDDQTVKLLVNVLLQEMLGLGELEYLFADENLEEIVITSSKEPVRIYHKVYGWLETNVVIDSEAKILNYANIIGRRVGRQITTLNPLLDAHLVTGDRSNAVLFPIATKGHTITIRKFARDPWTLTDFIKNKTCTPQLLALIWLSIQYEMNVLISGGTASGKTSFLNVVMPFIPPNHRIVSIEDSVHPESSILYKEHGQFISDTIGNLVDTKLRTSSYTLSDGTEIYENTDISVFSMNTDGKLELRKPSSLIRHKVKKDMYTVTLASGRTIKVTKDHSLFSLIDNSLTPVLCSQLEEGDFVATPRRLFYRGNTVVFDLEKHLALFEGFQLEGPEITTLVLKNKRKLLAHRTISQVRSYVQRGRLPVSLFLMLDVTLRKKAKRTTRIVPLRSSRYGRVGIPLLIDIDRHLACFIGLWLADGSYDKNSLILSVVDKECRAVVERVAQKIETKPRSHSDGVSLMINSSAFKKFFRDVLLLDGNAYTKELPRWIYTLDTTSVAWLLRGYMSGDGWPRKHDIVVGSCSLKLLEGIQTLFLRLNILFRLRRCQYADRMYQGTLSQTTFLKTFSTFGGFLQQRQNDKLRTALQRHTKDTSDVVPLADNSYLPLKHLLGNTLRTAVTYKTWKSWHGRYKNSNIGRNYLQTIFSHMLPSQSLLLHNPMLAEVHSLAFNDVFWDRVVAIKKESYCGYVYDLSVPGSENFICNNILCHNTRELQLPRYLYWCPLTVRQPNPEGKGEITMLDLLINSLRMRPDRIVLGEMRKRDQAEVLFEAMHTGHSVYATVHADSVAETIQRLINPPIEVPKNLLSGVNLNVVMFRDRRKGIRRVFQVGEFIPSLEEGSAGVRPNILYRWKPTTDEIVEHSASLRLYEELSRHTGMTTAQIEHDISLKTKVLEWMAKNNIRHVDDVGELMRRYYIDPESVLQTAGVAAGE